MGEMMMGTSLKPNSSRTTRCIELYCPNRHGPDPLGIRKAEFCRSKSPWLTTRIMSPIVMMHGQAFLARAEPPAKRDAALVGRWE